MPWIAITAVFACVVAASAPARGQASSSEPDPSTGTEPPAPSGTRPVPVALEFTLGGELLSHAVGGYSFSGGGFGATARTLGMERPLFGGGTLRAGLLINRRFAVGVVGSLYGLVAADAAPLSARFASQLNIGQMVGGEGAFELGTVLPLNRFSLRASAAFGVLALSAPVATSAHTCTTRTRGGGTATYTCFDPAGLSAPLIQVRLAADYAITHALSAGVEATAEPVPWFGWSAGVYLRLQFELSAPRREPEP